MLVHKPTAVPADKPIKCSAGISLLEVMLSLSIIAAVLMMATRYYQVTQFSESVNEATNLVNQVNAAAGRYQSIAGSYVNMDFTTDLVGRGYIPCQGTPCVVTNPWGGTVTTGVLNNGQNFSVTLTDVPQKACNNLAGKFPLPTALANPPTQCTAASSGTYTFETVF